MVGVGAVVVVGAGAVVVVVVVVGPAIVVVTDTVVVVTHLLVNGRIGQNVSPSVSSNAPSTSRTKRPGTCDRRTKRPGRAAGNEPREPRETRGGPTYLVAWGCDSVSPALVMRTNWAFAWNSVMVSASE